MKPSNRWKFLMLLTIFLAGLAFVPAVIPQGQPEPYLLAMPRTLWMSMLISLCIYAVLIAAMILSKED